MYNNFFEMFETLCSQEYILYFDCIQLLGYTRM